MDAEKAKQLTKSERRAHHRELQERRNEALMMLLGWRKRSAFAYPIQKGGEFYNINHNNPVVGRTVRLTYAGSWTHLRKLVTKQESESEGE
jgi:hypothetical protein